MSKITIYPEEPCLIPVKYSSNPLTVYNKNYSDIEQVLMCLKTNVNDDEDKYLVKYLKDEFGSDTGEVLIDEQNNTFTMNKLETDTVPVSKSGYSMYIGVKVSNLTKYLWLRVDKDSRIIVEPDGIKI